MCGNKIYTAAGNDGRDNSHLCITIQMSSVEDRWHQNWAYASPTEYFTERSHLREPLWNSKSKMNFDQPDRYRDSHRNASIWKCQTPQSTHSDTLNDDTKILTETDTETFLRYQIFRNRNRDFFPRPNFSETDTFLPRPNFPKPKSRLFSETNFFRNRDFFLRPNFSKPKP